MNRSLRELAERCAEEPWYAVLAATFVIGNKWKPVVLYCLLEDGPHRFNELQSSIGRISSKSLSKTLKEFERDRIVERTVVSERPHRVEYSLTEHGEALEPVLRELEQWANQHLPAIVEQAEQPPEARRE